MPGYFGLTHIGPTATADRANRTQWFYMYPDGSTVSGESGDTAPWDTDFPHGGNDCCIPTDSGLLVGKACDNKPTQFYCQYGGM